MSSGITFSGFNGIDFNTIVNAMMQAAAQPLTDLQTRQTALKSRATNLTTLSSRVAAVESAAGALSDASAISTLAATSSDTATVLASSGSGAVAGHYDVMVRELARAQVTASSTASPDANTTTVATGGKLTIGGKDVILSGAVTLQGLATAINGTDDIGVTATVVQTGSAAFRLVLTSNATGAANAFTVRNQLTDGATASVRFTDTNGDGTSGDSDADNAVNALDADVLVNNIAIKSSSNTLDAAIPGVSLTLLKKNASAVGVDVAADSSALKTKIQSFVTAYNALVSFTSAQATASAKGDDSSIGRDPLLRSLRQSLRSAISSEYTVNGAYTYLSQIGVEFTQSGTLQVNQAKLDAAVADAPADVAKLFAGAASDGAFSSIETAMSKYTGSDGLLSSAQTRLTQTLSRLGQQIDDTTDRLLAQRTALQQQFAAAELAMTQLKNQSGSLANFSTSLTAAI